MKVLQINSVCGYGSTGRIAVDLYHTLEEQGQECCIAYGRGKAPENIRTIKFGNKLDFYFHVLLTRLFDKHGFGSKYVTRKLIQQIKDYNPDVIHLHNIHGYYINIEILFDYLREVNKPVIWTLHDCWSFTGHCAHFDTIGCEKWKKQCEKCQLKKDYPQSILYDASKLNYIQKKRIFTEIKKLTIVTPSKWLAEMVKQSFLKGNEIEIIPNGIDKNVFVPLDNHQIMNTKKMLSDKFGIDFTKKIFLGVASIWTKDKGFFDFIKMSDIIPEDIQIVLVGVNKKQKEWLTPNMIGIERTQNQKELAAVYACSDVFLNPTYADTFPSVNMEALACGTPVVTYDTCGSPESVIQGCGKVIEKGNYRELVYEAYNLATAETINTVGERFDKNHFCLNYYNLYLECLDSK